METLLCPFCNEAKKNKNSLAQHSRLCNQNPNRVEHPKGMKGKQGKNQYTKAKETGIPYIISESTREKLIISNKNRRHSEKTKQLLSQLACKRLEKHSKYTKNVEYKPGVILESSYEVRTAEILDNLNISWEKVRKGYPWNNNGKIRRYIPDFYLPEYDVYLDPKNDYLIGKDKDKIKSACEMNNIIVFVLSNEQITEEYIQSILC